MKQASELFITLLEQERYFDAHEALEEKWFPIRFDDHPEKNMIRGLINAAVSFELIKRGRPKPANKVFKTYQKYLPLIATCQSSNLFYYNQCIKMIEYTYQKLEPLYLKTLDSDAKS
jgi:hypothetical protein